MTSARGKPCCNLVQHSLILTSLLKIANHVPIRLWRRMEYLCAKFHVEGEPSTALSQDSRDQNAHEACRHLPALMAVPTTGHCSSPPYNLSHLHSFGNVIFIIPLSAPLWLMNHWLHHQDPAGHTLARGRRLHGKLRRCHDGPLLNSSCCCHPHSAGQ